MTGNPGRPMRSTRRLRRASSWLEYFIPKACTYKGERKTSVMFLFPPLWVQGWATCWLVQCAQTWSCSASTEGLPSMCCNMRP